MSADENRGTAVYVLHQSDSRPVTESGDGLLLELTYGDYLTARRTITRIQHTGKLPMPLLRLSRDIDVYGERSSPLTMVGPYKVLPEDRAGIPSGGPTKFSKFLDVDTIVKLTEKSKKEKRSK